MDVIPNVPPASHPLLDTQQAFDSVAATYDRSNAENPTLVEMRRRTRATLEAYVPQGSSVLDLGCGPDRKSVV